MSEVTADDVRTGRFTFCLHADAATWFMDKFRHETIPELFLVERMPRRGRQPSAAETKVRPMGRHLVVAGAHYGMDFQAAADAVNAHRAQAVRAEG